jgi:Tol biopolymer transport system component
VPDRALYPQLSPDGASLAVVVDGNVWVHYVDGRPPVKATFEGNAFSPLWSRDGQRIVYEFGNMLRSLPSDGSGGTPQVESSDGHYHPHGWSPDGQRLIAANFGSNERGWDVVHLGAGGSSVEPIVATPAMEGIRGVSLSPDGTWVAYSSNVTGDAEIWVRPYPGPGAAVRVSPAGGNLPVWSRDGKELFYTSGNRLMAAEVVMSPQFSARPPRQLFESDEYDWSGQAPAYDVAPDGRFVMLHRGPAAAPAPVTVILNWAP